MDRELISASFAELEKSGDVTLEYTVANTDRSVGAMLSGEVVSRYGQAGLGKRSLHITFHGSAARVSEPFSYRESISVWKATPTITWARA